MDSRGTGDSDSLQRIIASATDAIVVADAAGRVASWNPAAEQMFGHAAGEIVGEPLWRIVPEGFREKHNEGLARVVATGETRIVGSTVEVAGLHADGHEFPIELSLATWSSQGRRHFTGIVRDITERKQAAKALELANKTLNEKNAQLEAVSAKLAKYLSRQVYDSIFSGRTEVQVKSYRRELTVFFSDIEGFTDLTDRLEAEALSQLLNRYLGEMSRIADDCGGTIDKFIGDGIMIFFGDPESHGRKEDAVACVRMALRMKQRAAELSREWFDTVGPTPLHFRMGVNTGWCTVGNFGSEDRLDYTIVGSAVNIASRLEETAGPNQIQVSHTTYALIRDQIYCRPLGDVRVKGVSHELRTYEVVGDMADMGPHERIEAEMGGFNLSLDPLSLDPAEAAHARRALQEALEADRTGEPPAGPVGSDDPDGDVARKAGPVT